MTTPPVTRRDDTVDELFGHRIADPYRWLEDADAPEVGAWVREQAAATEAYLSDLPDRAWFASTMAAVAARPRAGCPVRRAGHYVVTRNDGCQQQDVWWVAESLAALRAGGRVLVDPNTLSQDGTRSVGAPTFSPDGRLAAYGISDGGSDWQTIRVVRVEDGSLVDEPDIQTKFSAALWLPDSRSYLYLDYPHEGVGTGTDTTRLPSGRLLRHDLGTAADADTLVFEVAGEQRVFIGAEISDDQRYVVVSHALGSDTWNALRLFPISEQDGRSRLGDPLVVSDEPVAEMSLVGIVGSVLFLLTDLDAPYGRIVAVDLDDLAATGRPELRTVVGEGPDAILTATVAGDRLVVAALSDAQPRLTRYALDGTLIGGLDVPGGALVGLDASSDHTEVFVGMSSVTVPTTAYRVDVTSGSVEPLTDLVAGSPGFTPPPVSVQRRSAVSADGTPIPYSVIRAVGAGSADDDDDHQDGPAPTLLYGYGGFKIPVLADYRAGWSGWLAAGGTLVIANLRGGGEFGSAWHDAGRRAHKQNVFDDCIAVAEDLIGTGVTTADQLALHGRSNGGLLVGAVLTQRPDLLAAALPAVGVLDMLRFHRFTVGRAWASDYGDPDDADDFGVLLAYSPVHRIVPGVAYPPTLVMTGDHDDRVVPLHSHKFAAGLQHAQGGDAPILARIETAAGHGTGKSSSMVAAEWADLLAFAAHHTGLTPPD